MNTVRGHARILALMAVLAAVASAAPARAAVPAQLVNAQVETASGADLSQALRTLSAKGDTVWVGWTVPMVAGQGQVCCYQNGRISGCKLEGSHSGLTMNSRAHLLSSEELTVLVRFAAGKATAVRSIDSGCAVEAGGKRLAWLDAVSVAASAAYLEGLAQDGAGRRKDVGNEALVALALHAGDQADAALARMAKAPTPDELREDAIFWLGNARGRFGYQVLSRLAREETDPELLQKVAFALSQSPVPEAQATLVELAERHAHPEVRSQALFWLAQRGGAGVAEIILRAAEHDRSGEVREQAVFALSQLEDGEGVEHLLRLCKTGSLQARKNALFWLGQSDDPRAMAALEDLLLRRKEDSR